MIMTLLTNNCPWQQLVDSAYDRWQHHDLGVRNRAQLGEITQSEARSLMWSFGDLLANCSDAERQALSLGKLNQQVENGGVMQWVENGYAGHSAGILANLMPQIGPTSDRIWQLLSKFLNDWSEELESSDEQPVDYREQQHELAYGDADELDDLFYLLSDEWHVEVYSHIAKLVSK
jgi:hypothetical protein